MDRKDLDRSEYGSYEEVHEMLVRAMQDACMNDTSREYESPQIDMSFLYEDEKPKKTMTYKIIRSAAILFLAFGMLLGINAVLLTSDSSDVYGEKGLLHRIHEGVRGIFTDEDPSQYVEVDEIGDTYTIYNLNDLDSALVFWQDLCVPKYIPKGYDFKELNIIKSVLGEYKATYTYSDNEKELIICVCNYNDAERIITSSMGEPVKLEDRIINIYVDDVYNRVTADIYFEKMTVYIQGVESKREIMEIAKNMQ